MSFNFVQKELGGISVINVTFMAGRIFQKVPGLSNLCHRKLYDGSINMDKKHFIHKPLSFGGQLSSGVNDLYASYSIRCMDQYLEKSAELLNELLFNTKFGSIENIKKIIKDENQCIKNDSFKILLDRMSPVLLDDSFDSLTSNDVQDFYNSTYVNPAITVVSALGDAENMVMSKIDEKRKSYNVLETKGNLMSRNIEFKWNQFSNRIFIVFDLEHDDINELISRSLGFKINKQLRVDSNLAVRTNIKVVPRDVMMDSLIVSVEFTDIRNKDEIIHSVMNIMKRGCTKKEFDITKTQYIGDRIYSNLDPVKTAESMSQKDLRDFMKKDVEDICYEEYEMYLKDNFSMYDYHILGHN